MKSRFRRNNILGLNSPGGRVVVVVEVKLDIKNHFMSFDGVWFNQLFVRDKVFPEAPFLLGEIKDVMWNKHGEKSLGPDGFNLDFLRNVGILFRRMRLS